MELLPMTRFITEVRQTLVPAREAKYGLLPPLLVGMTVVTGLVDAFSYLVLGHVFVANMTGNVVFLAFALVGASGFSIAASAVALLAFALGAMCGGKIASRMGDQAGRLLGTAAAVQSLFLVASVVLSALSGDLVPGGYRYGLIATLAVAMGIQNAAARLVAVPDLTTSVLTMTITGLTSDARLVGGSGSKAGRRLVAIAAMLLGAVIGAILILNSRSIFPLVIALVATAIVAATTWFVANPRLAS
jgi:uncharacterized membrane protein YoaK (UPF0700 family)